MSIHNDAIHAAGFRRVDKVDGIMHCQTHDDFAIEGFDWSDRCHTSWAQGDDVVGVNRCDLVPMYVEQKS